MERKTRRTLLLLNGAFFVILLSPFLRGVALWLYYGLPVIGLVLAVIAGRIFFREHRADVRKVKEHDSDKIQ
ncbi:MULTISPECIES: hypothetical protein [Amylolactobacillus]|uniref:Uncharacterized protein n=1 Tax=Amylolactobacillus amylophilus DSM 20533 = JCM 1125 TaxID=1423721 RepID=A0A1L6XAN6_9LACO|nr:MULTISPECIES: hypothetical protein [Amylolactobacillus]APT18038.1 hypothetical protein LA20533_01355 [Amylolactobacillus amylophilus DSM 20533 = JCM 1125]GED81055.1 hypothetical protein LAM01_15280 [Amylolactobacillus amylophilus]